MKSIKISISVPVNVANAIIEEYYGESDTVRMFGIVTSWLEEQDDTLDEIVNRVVKKSRGKTFRQDLKKRENIVSMPQES